MWLKLVKWLATFNPSALLQLTYHMLKLVYDIDIGFSIWKVPARHGVRIIFALLKISFSEQQILPKPKSL